MYGIFSVYFIHHENKAYFILYFGASIGINQLTLRTQH